MDKKLLELSVEIVQAQVSMTKMSGEEIESALIRVYNALHKMHRAENEGRAVSLESEEYKESSAPVAPSEAADPRSSLKEDRVICLECGAEFRQLTANHLRTHQLSPREYKRKWGFPLKQPLAAKALTQLRSESAKERGLPPKLQQYLDDQRQKKQSRGPEESGGTEQKQRRGSKRGAA